MSLDILVIEHEHASDLDIYRKAVLAAYPDAKVNIASNETEALALCSNATILAAKVHDVSAKVFAAMPKLEWVHAFTTGVDHLRTVNLRPDIAISNSRGIHGPQMAELAIMHMTALMRDFPQMLRNQREMKWQRWPQRLLYKKTAVLLGVGAISEAIALRLKALGMEVIGVSSRASAPGFDKMFPRERLDDIAGLADFLIVLVPLTPETRHMVDATVLRAMKRSAYVINLARGPCIDEAALIAALQDKRIAGAGLDVFEQEPPSPDNPLWQMDNVTMTPRIGGMSDMYAEQAAPLFVENIGRFLKGGAKGLINPVTL